MSFSNGTISSICEDIKGSLDLLVEKTRNFDDICHTCFNEDEAEYCKFMKVINPLMQPEAYPLYLCVAPVARGYNFSYHDIHGFVEYDPSYDDMHLEINIKASVENGYKWEATVTFYNKDVTYPLIYVEKDIDAAKHRMEEIFRDELDSYLEDFNDDPSTFDHLLAFDLIDKYIALGYDYILDDMKYSQMYQYLIKNMQESHIKSVKQCLNNEKIVLENVARQKAKLESEANNISRIESRLHVLYE